MKDFWFILTFFTRRWCQLGNLLIFFFVIKEIGKDKERRNVLCVIERKGEGYIKYSKVFCVRERKIERMKNIRTCFVRGKE